MKSTKVVIGLDTSAYTTSLALVDLDLNLISNKREILKVPIGKRGLRQQDAVFQHIQNYPKLFEKLQNSGYEIVAIAATTQPRRIEKSYMPVFEVSKSFGISLAHTLSVPFFEFSHQEGHIESGMIGNNFDESKFLAYHLSGGTSELLLVEKDSNRYKIEIIGGSKDLSAGKLIDRIGVAMGLEFPAGKHMDQLAQKSELRNSKGPVSVQKTWFNLSGAETHFYKKIELGLEIEEIAYETIDVVKTTIEKTIKSAVSEYGISKVMITGGVASNSILRKQLTNSNIIFTKSEYCTDNAVGIANLGVKSIKALKG